MCALIFGLYFSRREGEKKYYSYTQKLFTKHIHLSLTLDRLTSVWAGQRDGHIANPASNVQTGKLNPTDRNWSAGGDEHDMEISDLI